jgi:hypothetical protein
MKENTVYNKPNNSVMVRNNGDEILIICDKESQMDSVVKRMTTDTCKLVGYEEWDEGKDKKWILRFYVIDEGYSIEPELN